MAISTKLSIIFNVNGLNAPLRRYRVADWKKLTKPIYTLLTKESF